MREQIRGLWGRIGQIRPEFFCLLMLLGIDFLSMAFGVYGRYFVDHCTMIPAMLFLGVLFANRSLRNARVQLWMGGMFALWFLMVQIVHYANEMEPAQLGPTLAVFLLAFPFAAAIKDGKDHTGLKMTAVDGIGAALVLALLTGMMAMGILPDFLKPHVYWDGTRLFAMRHPNICACFFLIGIGFSLYVFSLAQKRTVKLLSLAVIPILLFLIVLTNCRTTLGMALLMIVGYVFFCILHKGGRKRFLIAVVVMILLATVLLVGAISLKQAHDQQRLEDYLAQEDYDPSQIIVDPQTGEMSLKVNSGQNSFLQDLKTFNGRTYIWKAVYEAFRDMPEIRIWGLESMHLLNDRMPFHVGHAHNAWMETWVCLGTPGLVLALVFTVFALWRIAIVLFCPDMDMRKKSIAILTLCIMGTAMLEPYLFYAAIDCHPINMIFFLCLGYLDQWCRKPE